MIDVVLIVSIGIVISLMVRKYLELRQNIRRLRKEKIEKFYEMADKVIEYDVLTVDDLEKIAFFSETLDSRRWQFLFVKIFRDIEKERGVQVDGWHEEWPESLRALYARMFYYYLMSVCSQGVIIGYGAVANLVRLLDPNEDNEQRLKIEHQIDVRRTAPAH